MNKFHFSKIDVTSYTSAKDIILAISLIKSEKANFNRRATKNPKLLAGAIKKIDELNAALDDMRSNESHEEFEKYLTQEASAFVVRKSHETTSSLDNALDVIRFGSALKTLLPENSNVYCVAIQNAIESALNVQLSHDDAIKTIMKFSDRNIRYLNGFSTSKYQDLDFVSLHEKARDVQIDLRDSDRAHQLADIENMRSELDKFQDEMVTVRGKVSRIKQIFEHVEIVDFYKSSADDHEKKKKTVTDMSKKTFRANDAILNAVSNIENGMTRKEAAVAAGVGVATLYRYLKLNPVAKKPKPKKEKSSESDLVSEKLSTDIDTDIDIDTGDSRVDDLIAELHPILSVFDDELREDAVEKIKTIFSEDYYCPEDKPCFEKFRYNLSLLDNNDALKYLLNRRSLRHISRKDIPENPVLLTASDVIINNVLVYRSNLSELEINIIRDEFEKTGHAKKVAPNSLYSEKLAMVGKVIANRMKPSNADDVARAISLLDKYY